MRVLIAPGNHDALLPGSLYRRIDWPSNVTIFGTSRSRAGRARRTASRSGASRIASRRGRAIHSAEVQATAGSGVHLALFHGAELGSRPDGKSIHGPFRAERIHAAGFAAALCGHYHRRRLDPATGLLYPGTPEPLSFDEEGPRGPVLVEVTGRGHVEFIAQETNRWSVSTSSATPVGAGRSNR